MLLSSDPKLRAVQEKLLRGEKLSVMESFNAGRDKTVREIDGYQLKPDHCYRAVSEKMFNLYQEKGFIVGTGAADEYQEYVEDGKVYNNNKGVDWYLGGAALKYGDIVLECPADKDFFAPSYDNENRLSFDPNVKFFKSSGAKNPIPMTMITNVFDVKKLKDNKRELELMLSNEADVIDQNIAKKK